tara:strand:- start:29241 stop:30131 length:891 start_codon:yes stop_codon:yes gene_type:complete
MNYSPVILFVYNRPNHLKKTLSFLKKNSETKKSFIYIFSDGYKNNDSMDQKKVEQVRDIIKKINFFKKKFIFERKKNIGLRNNIIRGINLAFKNNSKLIILEDDILVSRYFLKFMNESLTKYYKNNKVWHISGWNYDINEVTISDDVFFIKNMNCWGWGTWKNRWNKINLESEKLIRKFSKSDKYRFNLDNSFENFSQIIRNYESKKSTWAIFWNATIYLNNGLCLNPLKSLTSNIGQDESGTNTTNTQLVNEKINNNKNFKYPNIISENIQIRKKIIEFLRNKKENFFQKILRYL